jgi:hypothetical protein
MNRLVRWIALAGTGALTACSGSQRPPVVLKTEDFIADPATMPTTLPAADPRVPGVAPAPNAAAPRSIPVGEATTGLTDVVVAPGPAPAADWPAATPAEAPVLIDTKIGEINGRPIRLRDFEQEETRIRQSARETRQLGPGTSPSGRTYREEWLAQTERIFRVRLNGILHDELLAAEARASLKPEQRMGLRAWVEEATQSKRRTLGGSNAELERQLRNENQNQQRFGKELEARILVQKRLEDVVTSRVKASWRDVKRYYQRNIDRFQPPSLARFRMIIVSEDNAEGVAAVKAALERGEPFAQVAANPANEYNAPEGGLFGDGQTPITGPYEQAEPFAIHELNQAARSLKPGTFSATPVARANREGKVELTWLYLESLTSRSRSLSDPDVQMMIADNLTDEAVKAGRNAYILRLVRRATYNDIDAMVNRLVEVMADRYWSLGN